MAIKERKQITGTTAQIDAYAGHEGQIVWDKEKKTFVGMSGTAGENYPLASQEYVDTQLTEGLAGKEDKGVCLPKTGGLLSGSVKLDPNVVKGFIDFGFDWDEKIGGGLSFRSINYERDPGSFYIYAQDSTNLSGLLGRPDGTLTWNGKPIDTIEAQSNNGVRYSSGLQICWGRKQLPPPTFSGHWGSLYEVNVTLGFNFPYPFIETPSTQVWTASDISNSIPLESWRSNSTGIPDAWFWFPSSTTSNMFGVQYIAIGRWK